MRVIYILSTFFVIYFFINSFICIFVLTYNLKNIMQQTKKEYMIIEDTERVIHSSSSENHTSACYGVTEGGYKIRKCLTAPDNG